MEEVYVLGNLCIDYDWQGILEYFWLFFASNSDYIVTILWPEWDEILRALIRQRSLQKRRMQKKRVIRICLNTEEKHRKRLKNIAAGHGGKEGLFKKHLLWKLHMETFIRPCVFLWHCQVMCSKDN